DTGADTAADTAGEAASAAGTMLGRGDANNRFNTFDNFNAIPTNRVWFGFMYMSSFETNIDSVGFTNTSPTGVQFTSGNSSRNFVLNRTEQLYRAGAEIKLRDWLSVSV